MLLLQRPRLAQQPQLLLRFPTSYYKTQFTYCYFVYRCRGVRGTVVRGPQPLFAAMPVRYRFRDACLRRRHEKSHGVGSRVWAVRPTNRSTVWRSWRVALGRVCWVVALVGRAVGAVAVARSGRRRWVSELCVVDRDRAVVGTGSVLVSSA